ncbi:hypothetical protein JCM13991_20280 [Thermodesulfovibrio hydrogeniphilus]
MKWYLTFYLKIPKEEIIFESDFCNFFKSNKKTIDKIKKEIQSAPEILKKKIEWYHLQIVNYEKNKKIILFKH